MDTGYLWSVRTTVLSLSGRRVVFGQGVECKGY